MEWVVGLEPTLFHIGSVVPYQLGDTHMEPDPGTNGESSGILCGREESNFRPYIGNVV